MSFTYKLTKLAPYKLTDLTRIKAFEAKLDALSLDSPITLLYDDDADGLTSGVFLKALLDDYGFINIMTCPKARDRATFSSEFLGQLESFGTKLIICVDFEPIGWKLCSEKKMASLPFDIVIIDHHTDQTEIYDRLGILFIHPLNSSNTDSPSQYCCAKFTYDVASCIRDISKHEWKQIVGMIGDMNVIMWGDFIAKLAKEFDVKINPKKKATFFANDFGRISTIIGFAASINSDNIEEFFIEYQKEDVTPHDLLVFEKKYAKINADFLRIVEHWKDNAEYDAAHDIYFVKIESKYMLASVVSSMISYVNDEHSFFFYQHNGEHSYHISMRSQKATVHLGSLLKAVASKFTNANGGGHIPAAGGFCNEADIDAYKKGVRDKFEKFKIAKSA
jgi:single-stranded DNA-specific DHH superfamily exonuclease